MSKKIYEKELTIVDRDSGELIQHQKSVIKKVDSDKFIQVYLEDMSGLLSIKGTGEFKVLAAIWSYADYDTNEVIIIKSRIKEIMKTTGLNEKTIRNIITRLVKKELIKRLDTALYLLNPKYFFKGSEINRRKLLHFSTTYEIE